MDREIPDSLRERDRCHGFSLLEVVVALAMLALIAIPAVGLATMAVSGSKDQMTAGQASELKGRIDTALRAHSSIDVMSAAYDVSGAGQVFWGGQDLMYIEANDSVTADKNDKYYKVVLREPDDYTYLDSNAYRLFVYEVTWPENTQESKRNQLFFPTVFRK